VVFVATTRTGWLTHGMYGNFNVAQALEDDDGNLVKLTVRTSCSGFLANDTS